MSTTPERATAERLANRAGWPHGLADAIESALLAAKAEARAEAIEECASMCASGAEIGVDSGGRTALLAMALCIREHVRTSPGVATAANSVGDGALASPEARGSTPLPDTSPAPDARAEMVEKLHSQWAAWRSEEERAGFHDKRTGWERMADFTLSETAVLRARLAEKDAEIERLNADKDTAYAWGKSMRDKLDALRKELEQARESDKESCEIMRRVRDERDALRAELARARERAIEDAVACVNERQEACHRELNSGCAKEAKMAYQCASAWLSDAATSVRSLHRAARPGTLEITPGDRAELRDPSDGGRCLNCGSPYVHWTEGSHPSGVTGPNGEQEILREGGWGCEACGAVEDKLSAPSRGGARGAECDHDWITESAESPIRTCESCGETRWKDPLPPVPSDADVLERAAEIVRDNGWHKPSAGWLDQCAAKLRQPAPDAKETK